VERVTGAPRGELLNRIITAIDTGDIAAALSVVSDASTQNIDMKVFLTLLLERVRSVLLLKYAPNLREKIEGHYTDTDFALLDAVGKKTKALNSTALVRLLHAYDAVGHAYVHELPLELALIEIISERPSDT